MQVVQTIRQSVNCSVYGFQVVLKLKLNIVLLSPIYEGQWTHLPSSTTVSYTHLDVYKRQTLLCACKWQYNIKEISIKSQINKISIIHYNIKE